MTELILKDVEDLQRNLFKTQAILNGFTDEFGNRLNAILTNLDDLKDKTRKLHRNTPKSNLENMLNQQADTWLEQVTACIQNVQKNIKGREFQHRFEKQALVIVFGVVKAGKSTLGNFIRGREFKQADFKNPYQDPQGLPVSPITVELSGRPDAQTKDYFDENSIESTCSAQYFSLPGLVWVDTPGLGAITKDGDRIPLAQIAKDYVKFADLVVFLSSSSCTGSNDDIENFRHLYQNGKQSLCIITRSDTTKPDFSKGRLEKIPVPKSPENRAQQENYLCQELAKRGIAPQDQQSVSISTKLAALAIQRHDDEMWKASNMGLLYQKLAKVISNERILKLKEENPKKLLNGAIEAMIGTESPELSLVPLKQAMTRQKQQLEDMFQKLDPQGELVHYAVEDTLTMLRIAITQKLNRSLKDDDSTQEVQVSLDDLQQTITSTLQENIKKHVTKLLGDYQERQVHDSAFANLKVTAKHQVETKTYTVHVPYLVEREPEGFCETLGSWFGKTYHRTRSRAETQTITIDLGFNRGQARQDLMAKLAEQAEQFVRDELDYVRQQFISQSLQDISSLLTDIGQLMDKLAKLKY